MLLVTVMTRYSRTNSYLTLILYNIGSDSSGQTKKLDNFIVQEDKQADGSPDVKQLSPIDTHNTKGVTTALLAFKKRTNRLGSAG